MTGVRFMQLRKPEAPENLDFDSSINAWGFTDTMGVWLNSPGHLWLYDRAGLIPIADLSAVIGGELPESPARVGSPPARNPQPTEPGRRLIVVYSEVKTAHAPTL